MRVRFFKYLYYNRKKCIFFTHERDNVLTRAEKIKMCLNFTGKTEIPFIDLDVNTVCDLKCEKCAKLTPYFEQKKLFFSEEVIRNLQNLLDKIDTIYALSIIGGEPFLNKDIGKVIRYCSDCSKIKDIDITTNATVMPAEEVFRTLANSRVIVHISDYNLKNQIFAENKKRFIQKLDEYKIPYKYFSHDSWLDFGPVKKHNYTDSELKMMYYRCPMNSCNIYNGGILYRCGRASYIGNHNIDRLDDVINVNEIGSKAEMKKALRKFYKRSYSSACRYCSNKPEDTVPGIQIGE